MAGTIEATADHLASAEAITAGHGPAAPPLLARARLWVLDLDLSPLGEPPAAFARNTGLLRLERPDLGDAGWSRCLRAFLARLHAAPRLYRTPAVAGCGNHEASASGVSKQRERAAFEGPDGQSKAGQGSPWPASGRS